MFSAMAGPLGSMELLVIFALVVVSPFAIRSALGSWIRWLRNRTAIPSWARLLSQWLVWAAAGALSLGIVSATWYEVGPNRPVMRLAEVAIFAGFALEFLAVAWLLACTWRWHWAARPAIPAGMPPYR
jgi:hypothetical protein